MMWQEEGCAMYELFFVNFWMSGLRTLKPKKTFKIFKKTKKIKT